MPPFFPTVITKAGLLPTPPAVIRAAVVAEVVAIVPGYTADLPGSLVEDYLSTATYALVQADQARVDLVNSLTPYGANEFLLNQLGQQAGVPQGLDTNVSVDVVFTTTPPAPGFTINRGFTVSDGLHQYVVQEGATIGAGGDSSPVFCVATVQGDWSVPANTVTALVTSVPSGVTLTVTNPLAGIPSTGPQTPESYRASVVQAGLAATTGLPPLLRTALGNVDGVQERLVGIRQLSPGWEVIVGGGDPYEVAYAIFSSLFDFTTLGGSTDAGRNETVSISDFPDAYTITFVNPVQQVVTLEVTWNTNSPNFVSDTSVAALAGPALVDYVNAVFTGQPMNVFEMQRVFQEAIETVLPAYLLSRLVFVVSIDGTPTPPDSGTGLITYDPEGYVVATLGGVNIVRG